MQAAARSRDLSTFPRASRERLSHSRDRDGATNSHSVFKSSCMGRPPPPPPPREYFTTAWECTTAVQITKQNLRAKQTMRKCIGRHQKIGAIHGRKLYSTISCRTSIYLLWFRKLCKGTSGIVKRYVSRGCFASKLDFRTLYDWRSCFSPDLDYCAG